MRTRQGSRARGDRPRRDHHDWASETYVDEWVRRQQAEDPSRAERFQLICDLFSFPTDATVTILDVGAGYGPVSKFILDHAPTPPALPRTVPSRCCSGRGRSWPVTVRAFSPTRLTSSTKTGCRGSLALLTPPC